MSFTTVFYGFREFLQVSVVEYHIMDIVCGKSKNNTWAYISKQTMANMLGISRGTVINAINNLERRKLIFRHPDTKHLKVCQLFEKVAEKDFAFKMSIEGCTNFEQLVQRFGDSTNFEQGCLEFEQRPVQKLNSTCTKIEHNKDIYIDNNKNNNKDKALAKEIFNAFRIEYKDLLGATVNGLENEFENFRKKHKDWQTILPELSKGLKREKQHKDWLKENNRLVPEPKNLKTWINNRCWEAEYPTVEPPKVVKTWAELQAEQEKQREEQRQKDFLMWQQAQTMNANVN